MHGKVQRKGDPAGNHGNYAENDGRGAADVTLGRTQAEQAADEVGEPAYYEQDDDGRLSAAAMPLPTAVPPKPS